MAAAPRPTPQDLRRAVDKTVPDVITPRLKVLFCGINPGLYSAAIGHHFGRPGNRFWPALQLSGFTERRLSPFEDRRLLDYGLGITNVVERATASADELAVAELQAGARRLEERVGAYAPRVVALLGVGVYRAAFQRPKATLGRQPERLGGAELWVLPNPSGLNAHYPLPALAELFRKLRSSLP